MALKVFIDTEFTYLITPRLVSIGLVAESGEEFYAELSVEPKICSEFVREVVLPLLGHDPNARMTDTGHDFHKKTGLPEHHALNDARANCYAFRERVL